MKTDRTERETRTERRETPSTPAQSRAWSKPGYTEVVTCAEIGAYAFRA